MSSAQDKRSITSAENGKKGGRPVSEATLKAQEARLKLVQRLEAEWVPIVDKAIEQAKAGDEKARAWLADRGYGKVTQMIATEDEQGNKQAINSNVIVFQEFDEADSE